MRIDICKKKITHTHTNTHTHTHTHIYIYIYKERERKYRDKIGQRLRKLRVCSIDMNILR